jgi:hypothetical protein
MKSEIIGAITGVFLIVIIAIIIIIGLEISLEKTEKFECQKWQAEARDYPGYFQTEWQKDQCKNYEIIIDAPVK